MNDGAGMKWDDGLTGIHRDIAASSHFRIGVLAGPGTGKTSFGLMRRVVRLLEEGVDGDRILLLSFTRVAAADLRDKVSILDAPGVEGVRATTLHGYCFGLLQRDSVLAITARVPRILLAHEQDLMLRDLEGEFGNIWDRRSRLEAYVAGWARGDDAVMGLPGDGLDRAFHHGVQSWLRDHGAMLIGEVVPETFKYLRTNPLAEALTAFDHVIVDEYQDLNRLEQQLLDLLAGDRSLCVAGDDDQSIYSVRYANPQGILDFLGRDDVQPFSITVCGRCPVDILDMANHLIRQAPGRHKPDLSARTSTSGVTAIVQWPDVETEVEGTVADIARQIHEERRTPGDILILTNWRVLGERLRDRLVEVGVAARSFFTEEELNADAAKEALALLRLVVSEHDAAAMRVLLGLGDGKGRSEAYRKLLRHCRGESISVHEALLTMSQGSTVPGLRIPALTGRFKDTLTRVETLRQLSVRALVDELLPEDNVSVRELRAAADDALLTVDTADDLLRHLVESITQDAVPQSPDFVRVMSLHKSKGLTSPAVYLVGAVDGILPTVKGNAPGDHDAATQEGRRLFYVAVTRAAEELIISSAATMDLAHASQRGVRYDQATIRRTGDRTVVRTIASPYIAELGPSAPVALPGTSWLQIRSKT